MNILFLNHKRHQCGVYQYGKRLYNILKKTENINYIYKEVDCIEEYYRILQELTELHGILYNYHSGTMGWLHQDSIQRKILNIGITHEAQYYLLVPGFIFDKICHINPDDHGNGVTTFSIPRPIFENVDEILIRCPVGSDSINDFITSYTDTDIPIFGSFGFGFDNKGFTKIINLVNDSYDTAVIKFVIPSADFDPDYNRTNTIYQACMSIPRKDGITLLISHDFLSNEDLLRFLKSNTMNIFMYDSMVGRGISSTIDYALSVKKPLGISDSYMFRNIYSDTICLYKTSIQDCIQGSTEYCSKFLDKYSHSNMIDVFRYILST